MAQLPIKFQPAEMVNLPIELPPVKKTKKDRSELRAAAAFAKFGVLSLRVKTETLAALGTVAEKAGIKEIGHGKIILASDNAEKAVWALNDFVDKLTKDPAAIDHRLVMDLMRLMREF